MRREWRVIFFMAESWLHLEQTVAESNVNPARITPPLLSGKHTVDNKVDGLKFS